MLDWQLCQICYPLEIKLLLLLLLLLFVSVRSKFVVNVRPKIVILARLTARNTILSPF